MTTHRPLVSFIMPAYNAESYISTAIEAIISQTVQDWELIIVDDCSRDNSLKIAETFAAQDSRIKVVKREVQSGGCYTPRKEAIIRAEADVVSPLDADDSIPPNYLARLLEVMEREGADAVYPTMYVWDGDTSTQIYGIASDVIGKVLKGKDAVKYTLDGWRIHCNGGLIKRNVYLKAFDMIDEKKEPLKSFIDEYLTRLILYFSEKVISTPVEYFYRDNPTSVTHSVDIRAFGWLGNNLRLLSFVEKHYPKDSEEVLLAQRQNFHGVFDSWRLKRKAVLTWQEDNQVNKSIREARRRINPRVLKGKVSPKYLLLLLFPDKVGQKLLYFADRFFS